MPIRVMLVDDSTIIRGLISRALTEDPNNDIVATANNGLMAIDSAKAYKPDVIILDIEMPEMDGITALPKILEVSPDSQVIMASTLTQSNASVSMEALSLGAVDYLPKPSSTGDRDALEVFYRDLRAKVKSIGRAKQERDAAAAKAKKAEASAAPVKPSPLKNIALKSGAIKNVDAIAIASSTGGPHALQELFADLKGQLNHVPIFITQHMPPTFTALLAEHIEKAVGRPCKEAVHGEIAEAGRIYVAPGDYHMVVEKRDGNMVITINQDPAENFCRPAADPMLRSLSSVYKDRLLLVVMTGMGQDGLIGAREVVKQGGSVIAQDKETSVVYGMPKAVADDGLCTKILPLGDIASYLTKTVAA